MKPRYTELKFDGKVYTKRHEIDDVLIRNKMAWFIDCEVENIRAEIVEGTLVINAGIIYNGVFVYGVIRSGEIRNIRFVNGVIHGGVFKHAVIERGIILGGTFLQGTIKKDVRRRGGDFEPAVVFEPVGDGLQTNPIKVNPEMPISMTDNKNESIKYHVVKFGEFTTA